MPYRLIKGFGLCSILFISMLGLVEAADNELRIDNVHYLSDGNIEFTLNYNMMMPAISWQGVDYSSTYIYDQSTYCVETDPWGGKHYFDIGRSSHVLIRPKEYMQKSYLSSHRKWIFTY